MALLCLKGSNRTWIGSVPPAVAVGSVISMRYFLTIFDFHGLTHPLPRAVLTRSNNDFRLLRKNLLALVLILLFAPAVFAQTPSSGTQPQPALATQLPLSGRNTQGGSVTATQTAIPGTTNSVNTISPTVQVQEPFTGSASSIAKMPFSGRLSLREAVDRAVEFNLGSVGLNAAVQQARGQTKIARSVLLPNLNAS